MNLRPETETFIKTSVEDLIKLFYGEKLSDILDQKTQDFIGETLVKNAAFYLESKHPDDKDDMEKCLNSPEFKLVKPFVLELCANIKNLTEACVLTQELVRDSDDHLKALAKALAEGDA